MTYISRRRMMRLSTLALAGLSTAGLAACDNRRTNSGVDRIDARVDQTLAQMFDQYPKTRAIAANSVGMLVMPLITEAGFGFGGGFGRGALRIGGVSVEYYTATKANFGLQIGANQYAHVLFFMTDARTAVRRRGIFQPKRPYSVHRGSVQRKFTRDVLPFAGADHFAVRELHRMQRAVDFALPEFDEFKQLRMVRRQIILLPDEGIEHMGIVRHPVEHFSGCQPVAFEHHFGFGHLHLGDFVSYIPSVP